MAENDFDAALVERMARAAHEVFCAGLARQGYRFGETTDHDRKTHLAMVPYDHLPEDLRAANRASVRRIPEKLAMIGSGLKKTNIGQPHSPLKDEDLEKLAQWEHQRWMEEREQAGWKFGPQYDLRRKRHPSLVSWDLLTEAEKEKDREMVRRMPAIVARAGFTIVPYTE